MTDPTAPSAPETAPCARQDAPQPADGVQPPPDASESRTAIPGGAGRLMPVAPLRLPGEPDVVHLGIREWAGRHGWVTAATTPCGRSHEEDLPPGTEITCPECQAKLPWYQRTLNTPAARRREGDNPARPLRVYVAGPYTADPGTCTRAAITAGNHLLDAGHAPLVPHLHHYWHLQTPRLYEEWLATDLAWVAVADVVLRLPGESPGADREAALARRLGIPVVASVDDLAALPAPAPAGLRQQYADAISPAVANGQFPILAWGGGQLTRITGWVPVDQILDRLEAVRDTELEQARAERDQYASAIRQLIIQVKQTAYVWSQTLPETIPTAEVVKALGLLAPRPLPEGLRDDLWQRIVGAYYVRFQNDGHPEDSKAAADEAMAVVRPELEQARARADAAETRLQLARDAIAKDGYFDWDEIGPDLAPRITERLSHAHEAEDAIERVRALHVPRPDGTPAAGECTECEDDWPCATIRALPALDGTGQPTAPERVARAYADAGHPEVAHLLRHIADGHTADDTEDGAHA